MGYENSTNEYVITFMKMKRLNAVAPNAQPEMSIYTETAHQASAACPEMTRRGTPLDILVRILMLLNVRLASALSEG